MISKNAYIHSRIRKKTTFSHWLACDRQNLIFTDTIKIHTSSVEEKAIFMFQPTASYGNFADQIKRICMKKFLKQFYNFFLILPTNLAKKKGVCNINMC